MRQQNKGQIIGYAANSVLANRVDVGKSTIEHFNNYCFARHVSVLNPPQNN